MTKTTQGYVYAVSQRQVNSLPNYTRVKIGYLTALNIEQTIHDRYAILMNPIVIMQIIPVGDGRSGENFIHYLLSEYRLDPVHETFNLDQRFGAWDDFLKAVDCMRKIEAKSRLPKPMLRRVDYDYWSIAKQAAVKGRQWSSRSRQLLRDREMETRKKEKENAKTIKDAMEEIQNKTSYLPKFFQDIIFGVDQAYTKHPSMPDFFEVFKYGCQHFSRKLNNQNLASTNIAHSSLPDKGNSDTDEQLLELQLQEIENKFALEKEKIDLQRSYILKKKLKPKKVVTV